MGRIARFHESIHPVLGEVKKSAEAVNESQKERKRKPLRRKRNQIVLECRDQNLKTPLFCSFQSAQSA